MPTTLENPIGSAAARFIAQARGRRYDPEIVEIATQCLVDWVGVALGAVREPAAQAVRRTVARWGAPGPSRILLGGTTTPALAALVNGTMGHCLDYDDTRVDGGSHLSSPTWSATLAVAMEQGKGAQAALGAFITGFEVGAALGGTRFDPKLQQVGFHPTSVFGRFSATAAACVLMGLDERRSAHALGVAATTAGGLNASFGTMAKPFHPGKAAMDGILAAQLAGDGFEAATHLFDAPNGLAATLAQDGSVSLADVAFTPGHTLRRDSFKPYACGKLIHGHIDAARQILPQVAGRPIRRIRTQLPALSRRLVGRENPQTHLEAKFSVPFAVALALNGHVAVADDFSAQRLRDPRMQAVLRVVELEVNERIGKWGSVMDIELEDGTALHAEVTESLGNPSNPLGWDDLHRKFTALVQPVLGRETEPLFEALHGFGRRGRFAQALALVAERKPRAKASGRRAPARKPPPARQQVRGKVAAPKSRRTGA
ncbi:MAG: MmgE/PrpD family protein [Candidatus Lambdaproteobacteria bacterium]|nr:MmgE/PrpD family protein [Candidatus Lambdaproteobacteria bacterium]